MAYQALVGSSEPLSRDSSNWLIGEFGVDAAATRNNNRLTPARQALRLPGSF